MNLQSGSIRIGNERLSRVWTFLLVLTLLDSLFNYFIQQAVGTPLPTNAAVAMLVLLALAYTNIGRGIPTISVLLLLSIGVAGYLVGAITAVPDTVMQAGKVFTAVMSLFIGFNAFRHARSARQLVHVFLCVGSLYIVVCLIALLKIFPSVFPVINSYGFRDGVLFSRPEVTIDQNFQIFYLFIVVFSFAIKERKLYEIAGILGAVASIFILLTLQTRSGLLIMLAVTGLASVLPVLQRKRNMLWLLAVFGVVAMLVLTHADKIMEVAAGMISRMGDDEFKTFWGRVYSARYLFEKLINPLWWVPRGNGEFFMLTGNIPHFSPTGAFLEGGILALVMWFGLFLWPLVRWSGKVIKISADEVMVIAAIGAAASMAASLSLNAHLFNGCWLWAGALIGAEHRLRCNCRIAASQERAELNEVDNRVVQPA
jgi:O-antigen ligase